jgi:hypothetical protein
MTNKTEATTKPKIQPTEHDDAAKAAHNGANRENEAKIKKSAGDAQENLAPFREQANHAHTH